jgi:hypothetical protein
MHGFACFWEARLDADLDALHRLARRSYELGRVAYAARHAAMVTVLVGVVSFALFGGRALVWLPVTLLTVALTEWRGLYAMTAARRGLLAGGLSSLLPLWVLRPCCGVDAKAMGETCCTMPSACWGVGAAIGLVMAVFLPRAPEGRRAEAAFGMIAGATSVTVLRCSMLFAGEAIGLLGGIAAALAAGSLARVWLSRAQSIG